ncbi:hypothetical protein B0T22DRAFT_155468 [Podospora appendiculata]|uniref:Large ribosomal subunit protein uL23m n=1 Tax=Podospora appendiculata TaxID=314037 RepID=A0AAE0X9K6_9PEZI|nr:hypothetical protein B0T22DRAFT_155468 [Podospora appendiculata]
MATSVAEAAARALPNFRTGAKQIFLPNHVITFIRPKPKQPPNLATFVVPLTFNKLDLRDYLFHAYNVEVLAVRSFINERAPVRDGDRGKWYRPRSQKMMIVELEKAFVWPEPPAEDAREDFDYNTFRRNLQTREARDAEFTRRRKGEIALRTEAKVPQQRKTLRKQAAAILNSEEGWSNRSGVKEDDGAWKEVEEEMKVPRGKQ